MCRTSCTASINFLSNRLRFIFKEIHELTCQEGGAYALSLFLSQTLHHIENKLGIISIQDDDTGKVGITVSSKRTLIGEQTVMLRKMKDLKFSRAPVAILQLPFRVQVSALNQGAFFFFNDRFLITSGST